MLNKEICKRCRKENGYRWLDTTDERLWQIDKVVFCPHKKEQRPFKIIIKEFLNMNSKSSPDVSIYDEPIERCPYKLEHLEAFAKETPSALALG